MAATHHKAGTPPARKWSQHVTETSNAMDLQPDVFKLKDPKRIARSLKQSAQARGAAGRTPGRGRARGGRSAERRRRRVRRAAAPHRPRALRAAGRGLARHARVL